MNIDIFWELFQALKTVNTNPGFRCCVNQERCVEIFEFFPFLKNLIWSTMHVEAVKLLYVSDMKI